MAIGPAAAGGYLRVSPDAARVEVGPSVAPHVAAALEYADRLWQLDLGPLEWARDVRPRA